MKKAYVILKKGFEYNDEINNPSEGGHPRLVVFSLEEAKKIVDELNCKEFKESSLSDYSYSLEDILDVSEEEYAEFNKNLVEKYGPIVATSKWENVENKLHPSASLEESMQYCQMVNFTFFEVIETDLDLASLRNKQIGDILE